MTENKNFNKQQEYDEKVKDLIGKVKSMCKKENIPFFFAACIQNDAKGSQYEIEMLSAEVCDAKLTENWISKCVCVTRGFDTVPPTAVTEINADDLF